MGELGKEIAAVLVIVLFLPLLLAFLIQGKQGVSFTGKEEVETYLPMMLEQVTDEDLHMETLKAQAVLMRSNMTKALNEGGLSFSDLQKDYLQSSRYRDKEFMIFYEKLASACQETEGEMVFYQDEVCYCPYFAVSSGVTRDAFENFTESRYPYLMSVPSHRDEESAEYTNTYYYEKEEFYEKVKGLLPAQDNGEINIQILEQDSAGYVKWLQIGEEKVGGEAFRKEIGLASACFTIEISESQVRIICKGSGHGFGFSRYGANAMAKEGKDYRELIEYYFQDITISKA